MIAHEVATFAYGPEGLRWLAVYTRDEEEQAWLLDVITEIEKREEEEELATAASAA